MFSILQGFIHVPKKPGGLKPELIDVDLVSGMFFFSFSKMSNITKRFGLFLGS